jgi:hypothetical protein
MKSYIFSDITPWSPLKINWRFGGIYRLHLQSQINRARYQCEIRCQAELGGLPNFFTLFRVSVLDKNVCIDRTGCMFHICHYVMCFCQWDYCGCYPCPSFVSLEKGELLGLFASHSIHVSLDLAEQILYGVTYCISCAPLSRLHPSTHPHLWKVFWTTFLAVICKPQPTITAIYKALVDFKNYFIIIL